MSIGENFIQSLPCKSPLPPFSKGGRIASPFEKGGLRGIYRFPIVVTFLIAFPLLLAHPFLAMANNWPGVDEAVVEKIAKEHGREPQAALINTDQGDLLLFLFLLAGAVGGFAAGYNWRKLMEGKPRSGRDVSACPHAETLEGDNS